MRLFAIALLSSLFVPISFAGSPADGNAHKCIVSKSNVTSLNPTEKSTSLGNNMQTGVSCEQSTETVTETSTETGSETETEVSTGTDSGTGAETASGETTETTVHVEGDHSASAISGETGGCSTVAPKGGGFFLLFGLLAVLGRRK